jgi:hypothetical protein
VAPGTFQGFDLRLVNPTTYGVTSKKILGGNYGMALSPNLAELNCDGHSDPTSVACR